MAAVWTRGVNLEPEWAASHGPVTSRPRLSLPSEGRWAGGLLGSKYSEHVSAE